MNDTIEIQSVTEKIDGLNARSWGLVYTESEESYPIAEEALALAEKENYNKGICEALVSLGVLNSHKGIFETAFEQLQKGLSIAEDIGDLSLEARAFNNIGILYCVFKNDYTKALEYNLRSLTIREKLEDTIYISHSLNDIGMVYLATGDFSKALEYYMRSLTIKEELNDKRDIGIALGNIGSVYSKTGNFSKAIEYHRRSLALFEETGNKWYIAGAHGILGQIYNNAGDFSKGLEYLLQSLALSEEIHDKPGISYAISNIGLTYFGIGDFDKAMEYHLRALPFFEEIGDKHTIACIFDNIGRTYAAKDYAGYDIEKALEYLYKCLDLFEEIQAKDQIFETHKSLADVYEQIEDWKNFAVHFKKYHLLKEEILNEENSKKITNLETQRKFAEIEKERAIERQKLEVTDNLLKRILPVSIADRMKIGEQNIADKFPSASVLFADIVGFTPLAEKLGADEVLKLLSGIFSHFDALCEKFDVEKIKTVGDSYMAASGVPVECDDHVFKIAKLAIAMQEDIKLNLDFKIPELSIRIGIHTGEVIAGVLGTQKLSYDIWGDTGSIQPREWNQRVSRI